MKVDHPLPFEDMSWLAVKNPQPDKLMETLDLSDPMEVTWAQGLSAVCGDYWDFEAHIDAHLSRVFITPEVNGWRLVVGGWFGVNDQGGEDRLRHAAEACRRLSSVYGTCHAFTTQGRMDIYSWILARDGEIYRDFVWDGGLVTDLGQPLKAEVESRNEWEAEDEDDEWQPFESDVMSVAAETGLDPSCFGPETAAVGQGLLAITKWGRENEVPSRPLDDSVPGS